MELDFFVRLVRYFCTIPLITNILYKIKYPKVGISASANLNIHGHFIYGSGCGVGEGANLIIPEYATLTLGQDCYIGRYVELGPSGDIKIGSNTSIQDRSILLGNVIIGRYCTIAPNVYISSGRHYFDLMPPWLIKDQDKMAANDSSLIGQHSKQVVVEDDCWLGINVFVMSGVTIGKGAVIGANSVVTKNVDPYTIIAGVPAKLIKKRLDFIPLCSIKADLQNHLPYFYSGFEVTQLALDKYSKIGGIAAQGEFVVCLNAFEGSSIHLIVKKIDSIEVDLIHEGERMKVTHEMREISFRIDSTSKTMFRFFANVDNDNVSFIVQKAWIQ